MYKTNEINMIFVENDDTAEMNVTNAIENKIKYENKFCEFQ